MLHAALGLFLSVVGLFLWHEANQESTLAMYLGALVFLGMGILISGAAFYLAFNTLEVIVEGDWVVSIHRWLGLTLRHVEFSRENLLELASMPAPFPQQIHKRNYLILARVRGEPKPVLLAEGLNSTVARDQAIQYFRKVLGANTSD